MYDNDAEWNGNNLNRPSKQMAMGNPSFDPGDAHKIKQPAPATLAFEIAEKQLQGLRITIDSLAGRLAPVTDSRNSSSDKGGIKEGRELPPSLGGSEIVQNVQRLTEQIALLERQVRDILNRLEI